MLTHAFAIVRRFWRSIVSGYRLRTARNRSTIGISPFPIPSLSFPPFAGAIPCTSEYRFPPRSACLRNCRRSRVLAAEEAARKSRAEATVALTVPRTRRWLNQERQSDQRRVSSVPPYLRIFFIIYRDLLRLLARLLDGRAKKAEEIGACFRRGERRGEKGADLGKITGELSPSSTYVTFRGICAGAIRSAAIRNASVPVEHVFDFDQTNTIVIRYLTRLCFKSFAEGIGRGYAEEGKG